MHRPRVYFNNIGSICTDSLRHGNGLAALLLLTRAAQSSAAKSIAAKHAPWKAGCTRTVRRVHTASAFSGHESIVSCANQGNIWKSLFCCNLTDFLLVC